MKYPSLEEIVSLPDCDNDYDNFMLWGGGPVQYIAPNRYDNRLKALKTLFTAIRNLEHGEEITITRHEEDDPFIYSMKIDIK